MHWKNQKQKKSKFYFHNFLANIVVHIQAKYQKNRLKIQGAYSIWKKVDREMNEWRTAQNQISFADYVSSRAEQMDKIFFNVVPSPICDTGPLYQPHLSQVTTQRPCHSMGTLRLGSGHYFHCSQLAILLSCCVPASVGRTWCSKGGPGELLSIQPIRALLRVVLKHAGERCSICWYSSSQLHWHIRVPSEPAGGQPAPLRYGGSQSGKVSHSHVITHHTPHTNMQKICHHKKRVFQVNFFSSISSAFPLICIPRMYFGISVNHQII